jgi:hypothetical protein
MRSLLRLVAIALAVAGVIDPAVSAMRLPPSPLVVVNATAGQLPPLDALAGRDVEVREVTAGRVPCAPGDRCVVVADGTIDAGVPVDLKPTPSLIALRPSGTPGLSIRSVAVSPAHVSAAASARVEIAGGVREQAIALRIRDGASVVGTANAKVSGDVTTVDVAWWPLDAGARHLRVEVDAVPGESRTIDNAIDVAVRVSASRAKILVFDARPSWSSTFVRRALEADARFSVAHRAKVAPAIVTATPAATLGAATLDETDVVIAGAPDALAADEVELLDRFVRVRGGTLILLPERRPDGPSRRWFAGWTEHLSDKPQSIGPLRASEVLARERLEPLDANLAASAAAPVIVETPSGEGRIIVSGAMDAWRYRDQDQNGFDRFWTALALDAAAAGAPLTLDFARDLVRPAERVSFTLHSRSFGADGARQQRVEANAVASCDGGQATAVRLWPSGVAGEFSGEMPISGARECTLDASVGDRHVTGAVAIADKPNRGVDATLTRLDAQLRHELPESTTATRVPTTVHPMRSPWWIVPFAGCLSIEWWLRRRAGLR